MQSIALLFVMYSPVTFWNQSRIYYTSLLWSQGQRRPSDGLLTSAAWHSALAATSGDSSQQQLSSCDAATPSLTRAHPPKKQIPPSKPTICEKTSVRAKEPDNPNKEAHMRACHNELTDRCVAEKGVLRVAQPAKLRLTAKRRPRDSRM